MILCKANVYPVAGAVAVLALAAGFLLTVLDPESLVMIPLALTGGVFVAIAGYFSPRFGFYTLLFSAMFTRFELPVGGVGIRPDQLVLVPVLAGVALHLGVESLPVLSWSDWRSRASDILSRFDWRCLRGSDISVVVFLGLGLYIVINALSTFLFAPQPVQSLKIVAWLVLSFLALAVVYFLIDRRYVGLQEAFFAVLAAGFLSAMVGTVLFLFFRFTGSTFGIQENAELYAYGAFQVYGTFFEANIFGSFQAFSALMGITVLQLRLVRESAFRWMVNVGTALSLFALVVSYTRAAWLAFFVGLLILMSFQIRSGRFLVLLSRLGIFFAVVLLALAVVDQLGEFSDRSVSIVASAEGTKGSTIEGSTLAFRLARFKVALAEWLSSPILGLGTNSFGQRHLDPSQNYAPDYLSGLFIATLYDVGLVGLLTLLAVLGIVGGALIWAGVKSGREEGTFALALLCGLTSLLVAYQLTNAFWFSYNWIIAAIAVRTYQSWRKERTASSEVRTTPV